MKAMEPENSARHSSGNGSESNLQRDDNDDGQNGDQKDKFSSENNLPGVKSCLTSRKKEVTINEVRKPEIIIKIENKINILENSFQIGIDEIRLAVHVMEEEKRSMELHIISLEDSLMYCNTNNEEYKAMNDQLKMEICELGESLQKLEEMNKCLLDDNESIQSEHTGHLKSIASKQRQIRIARRSFEKWKRKAKKKDINLNLLLQSENRKLKDEQIKYQEDAKQAFLRSVKTLNSEALSVFQKSNSRLIKSDYLISDHAAEDKDDSESLTSESSTPLSTVTRNDNKICNWDKEINDWKINEPSVPHDKIFFQRIPKQKNGKICPQSTKEYFEKSGEEGYGRRESPTILGRSGALGIKNSVYDKVRLESRGEWIEPNPIEGSPARVVTDSPHRRVSRRSCIADYVPDALRRETRHIMTQLQSSKKQNLIDSASKLLNVCDINTHTHICHCVPQPGKSVSCQYCTSKQNFNFSKMPLGTRPAFNMVPKRLTCQIDNDGDPKKSRNIVTKSLTPNKENKCKVIYQPSGFTVIEKHIN